MHGPGMSVICLNRPLAPSSWRVIFRLARCDAAVSRSQVSQVESVPIFL